VSNPAQQQYLTEIQSQTRVLPALAQLPLPSVDRSHPLQQVLALGEGSSYFALKLAQPWVSAWLGLPVQVAKPLNWLNDWPFYVVHGITPQLSDLLLVSQSGETGSLHHLLDNIPGQYQTSWLISNAADSSLAKRAHVVLPLNCSPEHSIPATVTMSASWWMALRWGMAHLPPDAQASAQTMLHHASEVSNWLTPDLLTQMQKRVCHVKLAPMVLLGQYHTVSPLPEVALKLMETSGQPVLADRLENFSHGPKAILASCPNVWVWVDTLDGVQRTESLQQQFPGLPLVMVGLGVTSDKVPTLAMPSPVNDLACQLMTLIVGQLLSWAWCVQRGESPNHPLLTKHVASL
jgi:glucosamine 6-phosphate synthetase-like amidotransferase/phosphosugar isomerase protein